MFDMSDHFDRDTPKRMVEHMFPIDVQLVLCLWSVSVGTRDVTADLGLSENITALFSHPYPDTSIRHVAADADPCLPPGQSGPEGCRDLSQ